MVVTLYSTVESGGIGQATPSGSRACDRRSKGPDQIGVVLQALVKPRDLRGLRALSRVSIFGEMAVATGFQLRTLVGTLTGGENRSTVDGSPKRAVLMVRECPADGPGRGQMGNVQ